MIGYLYIITNKVNGKKYIGRTNDINRRITRHFIDLKRGNHHSHKLQRAFNKYGKDNFIVTYDTFINISEEELAQKQIEAIETYDSYYNGYNETFGGEGHSTIFDFETSVLIFQLGQRYDGIKRMVARYYNCDHSTITNIMNRQELGLIKYDQKQLQVLINKIGIPQDNLKEKYRNNYTRKFTQDQVCRILAGIELKGYSQAACGKVYNVTKDIVQNIVSGKTYKKDKIFYDSLAKEDKEKYLLELLQEQDAKEILTTSKKMSQIKITQEIVDFIMNHKDTMTQQAIGQQLGIDRKRVGRIIKKETYKNLVEEWEKTHLKH